MKKVGLIEKVKIKGQKGEKEVVAKFDTGAARTSVDITLAGELGVGPLIGTKTTFSSLGEQKRPMAKCKIIIFDEVFDAEVTLSDRKTGKHGKHPVLIGRDIIHNNFLIDVSKSHNSFKLGDVKNGN